MGWRDWGRTKDVKRVRIVRWEEKIGNCGFSEIQRSRKSKDAIKTGESGLHKVHEEGKSGLKRSKKKESF